MGLWHKHLGFYFVFASNITQITNPVVFSNVLLIAHVSLSLSLCLFPSHRALNQHWSNIERVDMAFNLHCFNIACLLGCLSIAFIYSSSDLYDTRQRDYYSQHKHPLRATPSQHRDPVIRLGPFNWLTAPSSKVSQSNDIWFADDICLVWGEQGPNDAKPYWAM